MVSCVAIVLASAFAAVAHAHGAIVNAQGPAGPASVGFQVDPALARNCTGINPCQQDATLIRDAEISANTVNECGRTELTGNIDVGENTENALAAGAVTQVTKGSELTVTIHQVNADGAGPYVCDMDPTGNSLGVSGQTPLVVTNNVPGTNGFSQAKEQDFNVTVTLPTDMQCTGGSTGNICTIRCRNNAVAGPFGGCFAVQQTDVTPQVNNAKDIQTAQDLAGVLAKVQQNQADLEGAIKANQDAGSEAGLRNAAAMSSLLGLSITTSAFPVQTIATELVASGTGAAPAATTTAANGGNGNRNGKNGRNRNGNGNGNGNNNKRSGPLRLKWSRRATDEQDED